MWAFSVSYPLLTKKKSRAAVCLCLHVSVCINCQTEVYQGAIKFVWGFLILSIPHLHPLSPSPIPRPIPIPHFHSPAGT